MKIRSRRNLRLIARQSKQKRIVVMPGPSFRFLLRLLLSFRFSRGVTRPIGTKQSWKKLCLDIGVGGTLLYCIRNKSLNLQIQVAQHHSKWMPGVLKRAMVRHRSHLLSQSYKLPSDSSPPDLLANPYLVISKQSTLLTLFLFRKKCAPSRRPQLCWP